MPRHAIKRPIAEPTTAMTRDSVKELPEECKSVQRRRRRARRTRNRRSIPRASKKIETLPQPRASRSMRRRQARGKAFYPDTFFQKSIKSDQLDAEFHGEVGRAYLCNLLDERLQFGVGLRCGDIATKAERNVESGVGILRDLERAKNIALAPGEARWHDADDFVWDMIETQSSTEDVRIAEKIALPEIVAEDDDVCGVLAGRASDGMSQRPNNGGTPKWFG